VQEFLVKICLYGLLIFEEFTQHFPGFPLRRVIFNVGLQPRYTSRCNNTVLYEVGADPLAGMHHLWEFREKLILLVDTVYTTHIFKINLLGGIIHQWSGSVCSIYRSGSSSVSESRLHDTKIIFFEFIKIISCLFIFLLIMNEFFLIMNEFL